jgi:cytosine/adenosine deaminase-related metal-dependent hydrolase
MKVIHASWVCPVSGPPLEDAAVGIENGRVVEVRSGSNVRAADADTSFPGCALLPGFVNAHTHLELTVLRGYLENLSFPEWIRKLTRTKYEELSTDDLMVSSRLGAMECLLAGVTTVGEVMDIGTGWDIMAELGMHGVAYQEVFGPDQTQADGAMAALQKNLGRARQGETNARRLGVSPHAPYTVSAALYDKVGKLAAAERLPLAVHIAESEDEVRFVRDGTGPFADNWRSRDIPVTAHGTTPLGYLERMGILGPGTLAIHAIHASADDIQALADQGTAVVHCPKSNLKLGHAVAPVTAFHAAGIPVGLGSDSVASNNGVDMFEEMRLAVYLQRSRTGNLQEMSASEALRMATLDGAMCLGLESELGSIEEGKLADLTIVDLSEPALTPSYDPVETVVYSASRKNVVATYLAGEQVHFDAGPTLEQAQAIAHRING